MTRAHLQVDNVHDARAPNARTYELPRNKKSVFKNKRLPQTAALMLTVK